MREQNLLEWLKEPFEADHAICATFNFSPLFFENHILPRLQSNGATEITVLADAGQISDITEAKRVGLDYRLVPIHMQGAFHPKFIFQWHRGSGHLILGSHNLTEAGFTDNLELTWKLSWKDGQANTSAAPQFLQFLRDLTKHPALKDAATQDLLNRLAKDTIAGEGWPELIHNLNQPILDQIEWPGTDWTVLSPYHDHSGKLLERLAGDMHLIVQESRILGLPDDLGQARVSGIDEATRFAHAKAIINRGETRTLLLAGSPNATNAALATTTNVEVAILQENPDLRWLDSLLEGARKGLEEVPRRRGDFESTPTLDCTLESVRLRGNTLEITADTASVTAATVVVANADGSTLTFWDLKGPTHHVDQGLVAALSQESHFARIEAGCKGEDVVSNIVPVHVEQQLRIPRQSVVQAILHDGDAASVVELLATIGGAGNEVLWTTVAQWDFLKTRRQSLVPPPPPPPTEVGDIGKRQAIELSDLGTALQKQLEKLLKRAKEAPNDDLVMIQRALTAFTIVTLSVATNAWAKPPAGEPRRKATWLGHALRATNQNCQLAIRMNSKRAAAQTMAFILLIAKLQRLQGERHQPIIAEYHRQFIEIRGQLESAGLDWRDELPAVASSLQETPLGDWSAEDVFAFANEINSGK